MAGQVPIRRMTKSAVKLAREALQVAQTALPTYSSSFSPHKFTQPQLYAVLVLRQFLKTDYRGVVALLAQWSDVREVLGLKRVPTIRHCAMPNNDL